MKRMTAWLLAFSLMLLCMFPAQAAENKAGEPEYGLPTQESENSGQDGVNQSMPRAANPSIDGSGDPAAIPDASAKAVISGSPVASQEPSVSASQEPSASAGQESGASASPPAIPSASSQITPSASPESAASGSPAASQEPSASAGQESGASASPIVSPSASPEASPSPSATPTAIPSTSPGASPSAGASASPSISPTASPQSTTGINPAAPRAEDDGAWNETNADDNALGGIEVILRNVIATVPSSEKIPLSVVLKKGDSAVGEPKSVELDNTATKHTISFDNLEAGTYLLEITGPGFIKYKQDIVVSGNIQSAEIHTGFVNLEGFVPQGDKEFSYEEGKPHPGVMLIGDVNGDGVLNDNDRDAIMDAMSRGVNGVLTGDPDQNPTDLDRDGKTDLVDLQYYVNSRARIDSGADTTASLSSTIVPGAVKVNLPDTVVAESSGSGGIEDLLKGNEAMVSLKNVGGEDISEDAPVLLGFNLQSQAQEAEGECVSFEHMVISMGDAAIEEGILTYETKSGEKIPVEIKDGKLADGGKARLLSEQSGKQQSQLVIDLGGQIAIKKVTIKITATANTKNLAQISKVEFLNGMENRIPEPDMNIPGNLSAETGDKSFSLKWGREENVTGYEVKITRDGTAQEEVVRAASNSLEVKSLCGEKLENGASYQARVQSVNGTWVSGYSEAISVTPKVSKVPDAPDNLKATGGLGVVRLSWKNMKETDTYNVYYKEAGAGSFTKIEGVKQNRYEITGLKELTRYEVYVTGVNVLGEGPASIHSEAKTTTLTPAKMPNYKLINESQGTGKVSAHIVDAAHVRGAMVSSSLDSSAKSALGTVDKDFASYYQVLDWDDGAAYVSADKGLLFTLDDYYKMSYITFAEPEDIATYGQVSVYYYDQEHPNGTYAENPVVLQRSDDNGRKYYLIKLKEAVTANKVRLGFARSYGLRNITIAEVNFYHYDSLEDDILGLYENDLQTSLRADVTQETINELQKRLDTVDPKSGEYHPERAMLQRELDNAKGLLENGFNDVIEIKPQITARMDSHLGFSGLNAWQPLGITAYEGEQVVIYVGHDQLKTGANSALKLIATQYHAEAGALAKDIGTLKVGRNEITIPSIQSLTCEGGGALYVQYTGSNMNDRYAVRVNGGVKEPVLDLYGVTDETRRRELVTAYIRELEEHVPAQEALHKEKHETAGENNKVNRPYEKQNCILGATEIVLDQMMLSVSAEQILSGLKGSTEEKAAKLDESLRAMDEMMDLFYHHKGLSADTSALATDRMPAQHLNIRYMRMFAGAFMYAAGNHIGIEWGSVPGLAGAVPVQSENGKYISGNYFGWGIAHEIGHNINQGSYAIAEVTNNYFSVLAQAKDRNDSVRFQYKDVYKKVTSNTVGKPSNVFTHLAMYWQLHLAYDRGYNYKIYDNYQDQHENLFYARVDSYSRNTSRAPGSLKLDGGSDQNIMRLACAAAEKDLTEFFMRWGLVPDQETIRYANQFPKEERAIYYLNDEARVYEIEKGTGGTIKGQSVISPQSSVQVSEKVANEVNLTIQSTADENVILGYEIARCFYEDGDPVRQVIGFTTENTYQDHVSTINNRVMTYEVIAVDKFGYRSNAAVLGDVKISHNGVHDKSMWTVTTNLYSERDGAGEADKDDPCAPEKVSAIYEVIDNNYSNTYQGVTQSGEATVLISLNQVLPVCGLEYTVDSGEAIGSYRIEVSVDGSTWTEVKTGSFDSKKKKQTVYFENEKKDPWICTYDAAYVRLKAPGQTRMNISEIDLLGPSGDDISFGAKQESTAGAVGILQKDYVYEKAGSAQENVIPKGSLIFTGSYKGNPAYNVVVLYDEEGNVVGGVDEEGTLNAEQIILANVPAEGALGEVSRGTWIYWIKPSEDGTVPDIKGKVRAQLYRVDNAMTNEGQRLVSDTLPLQMPQHLEGITLENNTEE